MPSTNKLLRSLPTLPKTWQQTQLAYCSNVHPGESLAQVCLNVTKALNDVRTRRNQVTMSSGLWLSNLAVQELIHSTDAMTSFGTRLADNGIALTSLNGFPYGNFHQAVVKQNVYLPTWAQVERLTYSQHLAEVLAAHLSTEHALSITDKQGNVIPFGAISTLPLGYADGWNKQQTKLAVGHFIELVQYLIKLEGETGNRIMFGIEMEPDCVLESTPQLLHFFNQELIPQAQQHGLTRDTVLNYIGCCYDTCHQAVMFEDISKSLHSIMANGINICKIQISNAISTELTQASDIDTLCHYFNDSKFLHQCKLNSSTLGLVAINDMSIEILQNYLQLHQESDGKVDPLNSIVCNMHYHVPINLQHINLPSSLDQQAATIDTTQHAILETLDYLASEFSTNTKAVQPYIEIETYTWLQMLEDEKDQSTQLISGLVDEFTWLERQLVERDLLTIDTSND